MVSGENSAGSSLSTRFNNFPWAPLVIGLAMLGVLVRLPTHFWLDETMSYWTASHGFQQILVRCTMWPHPVLYSTLILAIHSMGFTSEWIYRAPSFLAMSACAFALFRMTRRLFGSETAWMSTAVFVLIEPVRFEAGDARPYALALLFAVVATDLFLKLLAGPSYKLAFLYALSGALMLYFQILYGVVLAVHGIYFVFVFLRGKRIALKQTIAAWALLLLLAAPVFVQFLRFTGNAAAHSFAARPALPDFAAAFTPGFVLYALEFVAVLALLSGSVRWARTGDPGLARMFLLWALLPPVLMFAISRVSPAHLFVSRYFLCYSPGLAVCFGIVLASFRPRFVSAAILSVFCVFAAYGVVRPAPLRHTDGMGDWADTAAFVTDNVARDHAPVLIRSQFIESDFVPISPIEDNGAFAQLGFYPMQAPLVPLPNKWTAEEGELLHSFLQKLPPATSRFLLVSVAGPAPLQPYLQFLEEEVGSAKVHELADFDGVAILEFRLPKRSQ